MTTSEKCKLTPHEFAVLLTFLGGVRYTISEVKARVTKFHSGDGGKDISLLIPGLKIDTDPETTFTHIKTLLRQGYLAHSSGQNEPYSLALTELGQWTVHHGK